MGGVVYIAFVISQFMLKLAYVKLKGALLLFINSRYLRHVE